MKKDINLDTLAIDFIGDIFPLLQEFCEMRSDKVSLRKKLHKEIKKENEEQIDHYSYYSEIKKSNDSIKSQVHLQNALFTYLYSIYEKHLDELVKFSIRKDTSVRGRYFQLYSDFLKDSDLKLHPNFINLSKVKQTEFILEHLSSIKKQMVDLNREQFLFDIPDKIMWKDKNLKFNLTEIRARRNLITHRKAIFDKRYVVDIKNSVKKSKKVEDPKTTIAFYVRRNLYPKIQSLDELTKKNFPVRNDIRYFFHVLETIINIYSTVWNYTSKSSNLTSTIGYELNKLYLAFPAYQMIIKYGEKILKNYKEIYPKKISPIFNVNYLLTIKLQEDASIDLIKKVKKDIKASRFDSEELPKIKQFLSHEQSLQKSSRLDKDDSIQSLNNINPAKDKSYIFYQMAIAVSMGRSKDCINLLKKADVVPSMVDWPLFKLLFKDQKLFKDAFESQLKKTKKKHKL